MGSEAVRPLDLAEGLSTQEARRLLAQTGPNRLRPSRRESIPEVFLGEIREPMILLLLATGVLYSAWGELTDAVTIFAVILTLVAVEVVNGQRAGRAIAALAELSEPAATVLRDGRPVQIPAEEVVPRDVVVLVAGRRIPADARLIETQGFAVDESTLTGESVPVEKTAHSESPPDGAEQGSVFAGTTVTRGHGLAVVVSTGERTEVGRIAQLTREVKPPRTPLQLAMRELSRYLVFVALGFSVLVPLLGFAIAGEPPKQMVLIGLSLAFATIPEEMPIIITMVLGLGAFRLSKRRAIVKRLRAVETLGAITLIATDKTGTLTQNEMRVARLSPSDFGRRILEIGVLASDVVAGRSRDPSEEALVRAATGAGIDVGALIAANPVRDELPFDDERKLMTVVREREHDLRIVTKGAPEAVLARCSGRRAVRGERLLDAERRSAVLEEAARMAAEGYRVLAFAEKVAEVDSAVDLRSELVFTGLAALADPPRPEAASSIAACREAGIRPIMVTGDHPETARAIASQVGLDDGGRMLTGRELDTMSDDDLRAAVAGVTIFARTTPAHKLRIVQAARSLGNVVAVTGDGVNDAPALAAADIGIAMGETGTDVAREAADIVLADDDFATIVHAVEEGRVLFANLRKGVRYYLACKVALVSAVLLPVLIGVPVPFAPVQIILMELFMDLAASATFAAEPPESGLMRLPPRDPRLPFMDREMLASVLIPAAGLSAAVSAAYLATWYSDPSRARTVAFVAWLLGHFFMALNLRAERAPLHRIGIVANRLMLAWGAAAVAFVAVAVLVPSVHHALRTVSLSPSQWALAAGTAFAGTFWMEVWRSIRPARS